MEEHSKAIVLAASPSRSENLELPEADTQISDLLYDMSQKIQVAMQGMAKMASEIGQSSSEIAEDMQKYKETASVRYHGLDEEKQRFQKAALAVIEMLSTSEGI